MYKFWYFVYNERIKTHKYNCNVIFKAEETLLKYKRFNIKNKVKKNELFISAQF